MKHGGARTITIGIAAEADELLLSITDDGTGFAVDQETRGKAGRFGCMGIRERCQKLGATVEWRSELRRGSTVTVRMPLKT